DHRGHALWNILIRTAQWRSTEGPSAGEVSLRVGGGITWASVASEEERESRLKGTLLARALAPQGDATGLGPDLTQG
ncbi:MAG: chorismate-binding protein, partial [Planctomycetota bacterium]|nr:chorismate-binding protein [Planctomycetota bacterium]